MGKGGIQFFFAHKETVALHRDSLTDRFETVQTVSGTCSHHCYVPLSDNKLKMFRLSGDTTGTTVSVSHEQEVVTVDCNNLHPGQFVAVIYDAEWFVGCITERSDEQKDILVKFMNKTRSNLLTWPRRDDICWVPFTNVLCCLPPPALCGSRARQYKYDDTQFTTCQKLFETRVAIDQTAL